MKMIKTKNPMVKVIRIQFQGSLCKKSKLVLNQKYEFISKTLLKVPYLFSQELNRP